MKKFLVFLWAISLVFGMGGIAGATVIDFDYITTDIMEQIPSDYKGFIWDEDFYVASDNLYMNAFLNSYGSISGEYAAFNSFGISGFSVTLASGDDFDFIGAYFTGFAYKDGYEPYTSTSITVTGYNDGAPVGSVMMNLSANQYDWFQADLMGVNNLTFEASGEGAWWLMDDFTYNKSAPVPEPATILLLGSGLIGMGALVRKKFHKKG